jgi:molecular chaperone DnaK
MRYHRVIGIDLGTAYSAVSVWDTVKQEAVVIKDTVTGLSKIPSVVGLDSHGKVIVGAPAQNNLIIDPGNTVIEVKRWLGTYQREPDLFRNDPGTPKRFRLGGRDYLPQEITAFILKELKRMAEDFTGKPVYDAVITVPACFREPQRGAVADTAAMAGLNVCMLLNSATAAALSFAYQHLQDEQEHSYIVYDLGGGLLDISIVSVTRDAVSVVGTGGDTRLGGADFDDRITGYVVDTIRNKYSIDLSQEPDYPNLWARIKREAELRKRELSTATSTLLNLQHLTPQLSLTLPLSRATFEGLVGDLLKNSLDCLDQALESAYQGNAINRDRIEQVLLVGGSTRMPCIRPMLAEHMKMKLQDIRSDIDPDEAVVRGAAIFAMRFRAKDGFEGEEIEIDTSTDEGQAEAELASTRAAAIVLNDVTSHSLGIMINGSDFLPLIPKDSPIPARCEQSGFTNGGRTRQMEVMILQGEDSLALNNTLIGKLVIPLPEERERGYYQLRVIFALDTNGLLNVSVLCLNDNTQWDAQVQCSVRASREAIEQSARHLQEVLAGQPEEQPAEPPPARQDRVRFSLKPKEAPLPTMGLEYSEDLLKESDENQRQMMPATPVDREIDEAIQSYQQIMAEMHAHPIDSLVSLEAYATRLSRLQQTVERLRGSHPGTAVLDDFYHAISRDLTELNEIKSHIRASESLRDCVNEYNSIMDQIRQHPIRSLNELAAARDKLLRLRLHVLQASKSNLDAQGREVVVQLTQAIEQNLKQIDPNLQFSTPSQAKPEPRSEAPGAVDKVHFSVTAPPQVQAGSSFVVDLWAHLEQQRQEVIHRAQQAAAGREVLVKSKGPLPVRRGTVLSVHLKIEEMRIDDAEETILWEGEIGSASFAVQVPQDVAPGVRLGRAAVYADGVGIARLNFELQVGAQLVAAKPLPAQEKRYCTAFASYASADRDAVLRCIQGMEKAAPWLNIFVDVHSLRSGQHWEQELWERIPASDVFYLFWSTNAKRSAWVEKEWRCALSSHGADFIDPIPLEPPDLAPPPPELCGMHFNDWQLAYLRNSQKTKPESDKDKFSFLRKIFRK